MLIDISETKTRNFLFDGIKGLACIGVFIGHFMYCFLYKSEFGLKVLSGSWMFFCINLLSPVFNGGFWVFVFCIISGYLAAQKEIFTNKELVMNILYRYLRFVVSFLFYGSIILIIRLFVSTDIGYYQEMLRNTWILRELSVSFRDYVKFVFLFDSSKLIVPVWVIRGLFLGTVIIFILRKVLNGKRLFHAILLQFCTAFSFIVFSFFYYDFMITAATVFGMIFNDLKDKLKLHKSVRMAGIIICYLFLMLKSCFSELLLSDNIFIVFLRNDRLYIVIAFIFMLSCYMNQNVKRIFSGNFFQCYGRISFEVYLIHMEIILLFSLFLSKKLFFEKGVMTYPLMLIVNLLLTFCMVVFLSLL